MIHQPHPLQQEDPNPRESRLSLTLLLDLLTNTAPPSPIINLLPDNQPHFDLHRNQISSLRITRSGLGSTTRSEIIETNYHISAWTLNLTQRCFILIRLPVVSIPPSTSLRTMIKSSWR